MVLDKMGLNWILFLEYIMGYVTYEGGVQDWSDWCFFFLMGINHVNAHYKLEYNLYRFSYIYIHIYISTYNWQNCSPK